MPSSPICAICRLTASCHGAFTRPDQIPAPQESGLQHCSFMEIVPLTELDDTRLSLAREVQAAAELAIEPEVEPITVEELRALAHHDRGEGNVHIRLGAFDDAGNARAVGHLDLEQDEVNAHFCAVEVFRATGDDAAAHAMARALADIAHDDGRTVLMAWIPVVEAETRYWGSVGAEQKYLERVSGLDLAAVDAELMQQWIDRRTERAGDIELVHWIGNTPEHLIEAWAASRTAMNDAPIDDMDIEDGEMTVEDIRIDDASHELLGTRTMNIMALDADGNSAGHTTVLVNTHRPSVSWQWDTVTLAPYRGRGIGRWLKAAMWQWMRSDAPEVDQLRTGNAESNDAMLSINVGMGYRPVATFAGWQVTIDELKRRLG